MHPEAGQTLLTIARSAIAEPLGEPSTPFEVEPWLEVPSATFVTLTHQGQLRGCVGSLVPQRPLFEDLAFNARAAAFHDTRFSPLTLREFARVDLEVSLLSPPESILYTSQAHLLGLLRPGRDGVILEYGWWRATFLPQVWEALPEPRAFLDHLKQKAGLPLHFWADDIRFSRYSVQSWRESEAFAQPRGRCG